MSPRLTCVDCGLVAADIEATDTRSGAQYGWRLSRRTTDDGRVVAEFRCPQCWGVHRDKKKASPPSP